MADDITNACFGCKDRTVGCHSGCPRYKAYREDIDTINKNRSTQRDIEGYFDIKTAKIRKSMKGRLDKKWHQ